MFSEKNILIVGASSGIGLATAKSLSQQGAQLHTYSRNPLPEELPNASWTALDVTAEQISLGDIPKELHGLVYCPGTINLKPFNRISAEEFQHELQVNIIGAFKVLQEAHRSLQRGKGSVVLFSTVAMQTGMTFHAGIAAAKGAVEGLTRALAAEWAPKVRVNAIAPSLTNTPLAEKLLNSDARREQAVQRHPLKDVAEATDIAHSVQFLLSEQARMMTGQVLHVDGGMGVLK